MTTSNSAGVWQALPSLPDGGVKVIWKNTIYAKFGVLAKDAMRRPCVRWDNIGADYTLLSMLPKETLWLDIHAVSTAESTLNNIRSILNLKEGEDVVGCFMRLQQCLTEQFLTDLKNACVKQHAFTHAARLRDAIKMLYPTSPNNIKEETK